MPKNSKRRVKKIKRKTRKNNKKTRKNYRNIRFYKKGGTNYDKVNCCMCGKEFDRSDTTVPLSCLRINGENAHRICSNCWWNPKTGFGRENANHGCPGCATNFPLTKNPEIYDLTLEDD